MADIAGMLDDLQYKTAHNPEWKARFLASREEADPISAFCRICREFDLCRRELLCIDAQTHQWRRRKFAQITR